MTAPGRPRRGGNRFQWLVALILSAVTVSSAAAQGEVAPRVPNSALPGQPQWADSLSGRVVQGGNGVEGVEVVLHRVTPDSAGEVARQHSGPGGVFSFRVPPPDTAGFTVFFTTADYLGVRYYGPPIHPGEARPSYSVAVFDTTGARSASLQVQLGTRNIVLIPESDGGWEVNEVLEIRNPEQITVVPASGVPPFEHRLPAGVSAFEVGESEVSPDDVKRMGDRVFLMAPLPPGSRELFLRYRLPARNASFGVPIVHRTETLNLFVRQPAPVVNVRGLAPGEEVRSENERFVRFSGASLGPESEIRIERGGAPSAPVGPIPAAIAVVLVLLAAGVWAAVRASRDPLHSAR